MARFLACGKVRRSLARGSGRRGLTLVELVVVLLVLAGLAGLIVPSLGGMLQRAHGGAGAAGLQEVAKAVQMHEALYGSHPEYYDSLFSQNGVSGHVILQSITDPAPWLLVPKPVDNRTGDALNAIGITTTCLLIDPDQPVDPGAPDTLSLRGAGDPTGWVVWLSYEGIERLGLEPISDSDPIPGRPYHYVVFGVGSRCTTVGRTMAEAPRHFPTGGQVDPARDYGRYFVIYEIPGSGPARLAAVAVLDGTDVNGLQAHLTEYYEAVGTTPP